MSFGKSLEEGRDMMLVRVNRVLIVTLQNKPERSVLPSPSRQQRKGGCKRLRGIKRLGLPFFEEESVTKN